MRQSFVTAAMGLALAAFSLVPASAQQPRGSMPGMGMGMMGGGCPMMGMMGRGMRGRHGHMGAMAEGRLAYLKAQLKITDVQNSAWGDYADAVKARVAVMQGMRESMMEAMQKGDATARMDARIKGMEAMLDAMKAVKPATEKLYAALDNDQKKIADELIGMHCGAM